ncbi:transcription factor S [Candidatus Woesearchaeota archaeon]|nr:transcription factor S [Candidatus Woesearchaeota archaeon]HIH26085.1 transcription factor S [Nanoarchaeota archaeon]
MIKIFCPKCDNLLMPKDGKMKCSCGYTSVESKITEKKKKSDDIVVVDKNEENLPRMPTDCTCGNTEAYFWTKQTRGGDEPETRFFKCTKCSKVWREY